MKRMKLLFKYDMTKEVSEAAADILLDSLSDFHYDRRGSKLKLNIVHYSSYNGGLKRRWRHTVIRVVNAMERVPE